MLDKLPIPVGNEDVSLFWLRAMYVSWFRNEIVVGTDEDSALKERSA